MISKYWCTSEPQTVAGQVKTDPYIEVNFEMHILPHLRSRPYQSSFSKYVERGILTTPPIVYRYRSTLCLCDEMTAMYLDLHLVRPRERFRYLVDAYIARTIVSGRPHC